ncbi:MAG: penicillin-insensitive murein endopeptidase [Acidobacteriota bacterium]|nr:penicillin-insensitive murein endopeptidase [Acidobacteriota bacterium]
MAILRLKGSVGSGSAKKGLPHNEPEDVTKVRNRLVELGFQGIDHVTDGKDKEFLHVLQLFQCITKGKHKLDWGDSRVDVHGTTHKWLAAQNAPGWVHLEGKSGIGWQIAEFDHGNSWGSTWMLQRVQLAGLYYRALVAVSGVADAPSMWIRDCAKKRGGKTRGHGSHQTGIDLDMRLPLLPPDTNKYDQLKGHDYDARFHRAAALLQCEAIKTTMNTRFVFFNDKEFKGKGLTTNQKNHSEHYHIRIRAEERVEGVYM